MPYKDEYKCSKVIGQNAEKCGKSPARHIPILNAYFCKECQKNFSNYLNCALGELYYINKEKIKMITYFYDNETKKIKGREKYIVYKIEHRGNIDIAERKVKTFAHRLNRKLAGGGFNEGCEPYNLKTDYTIINVPYSTRTRAYDKKDKYIIGLIEYESGTWRK